MIHMSSRIGLLQLTYNSASVGMTDKFRAFLLIIDSNN